MLNGNLGCVPVINSSHEVVRLIFWKELFQSEPAIKPKPRLNLPVVIMAGGRGTRLAPFTNVLPKPLIPMGDRTVIEIIIEQFLPYGLDRFLTSQSITNPKFSNHFSRSWIQVIRWRISKRKSLAARLVRLGLSTLPLVDI